jgi:hypothetical protein
MAAVAGMGVTAAHADSFSVYTGYADNLRTSGFFPTPWLGDASVVSQSSAGQSFDSGAVRIFNSGATPILIENFTVTMNGGSGPTYAIWNPLTIGPHQNGIFTQTTSYNFDSSDNSFGNASDFGGETGSAPGSNGIGGCSSTAAVLLSEGITAFCAGRQPIVSFDENGTLFTLNDTGHIIDTGNYDFINGSPDGNESINWNLIGSGATRGGSVPEPAAWVMMLLGVAGVGLAARRKAQGVRALA